MIKNPIPEVVLWHIGLRIWHCHFSGTGHYCGMGLIPGPGISTNHGHSQREKKKKKSRSSCCGSAEMNLTSIYKDVGLIPDLTQWVKDLALPRAAV